MIREATHADLPRCVELGQHFLHQTAYVDLLADNSAQMRAIGESLLRTPDGVLLVAEADGQVIGMIGMLAFPHHLSGERTAGEVFFWVEPDHRGVGVRLLRAAEAWGITHGAVVLHMTAPLANPDAARLYEHLGYEPIETAYQRRVS